MDSPHPDAIAHRANGAAPAVTPVVTPVAAPLDPHAAIATAVRGILLALGEDPTREGLADTPKRVAKMYLEVFQGLTEDPRTHLAKQFTADRHEDIVVVRDISFYSMCEHHLLPFFGKAHVAYMPDGGRLTGLSKLARAVHAVARRPQLQERLTAQIADAMVDALAPRGVMVLVEAEHMCMAMRGVRSAGSTTLTAVSHGMLETDPERRAEAFAMLRG